MGAYDWTDEQVSLLLDALGRHKSAQPAIDEFNALRLRHVRVSYDMVKSMLRGRGLPSVRNHLNRAPRVIIPPAFEDEPPTQRSSRVSPQASSVTLPPSNGERIQRHFQIPDCHIPWEDKRAYGLTLRAIEAYRPHVVHLIGDYLDCHSISSHGKPADKNDYMLWEISEGNERLDALQAVCARAGVQEIRYCEGNHEDRLSRYIADKARELFGIVSLPSLLHLEERGIKWFPYRQPNHAGKMMVIHDMVRCGVNACRDTLNDVGQNVVFGHTHRAGIHYDGDHSGVRRVGANIGWLGDMDAYVMHYRPKVMQSRQWIHGFGYMYLDTVTDNVWQYFAPIVDGAVCFGGHFVS